jgi:hypothetical protein
MQTRKLDNDSFMNVALEIFSTSDLEPLAEAFGSKVQVFYLGMEFGLFKAYFYPGWQRKTPESGILRYCKLVKKLPPSKRKIWNAAKSRSFDIGIKAPGKGRYYWSAVGQEAVRAAAEVDAQIAITVYGTMKAVKRSPKTTKAASSE